MHWDLVAPYGLSALGLGSVEASYGSSSVLGNQRVYSQSKSAACGSIWPTYHRPEITNIRVSAMFCFHSMCERIVFGRLGCTVNIYESRIKSRTLDDILDQAHVTPHTEKEKATRPDPCY